MLRIHVNTTHLSHLVSTCTFYCIVAASCSLTYSKINHHFAYNHLCMIHLVIDIHFHCSYEKIIQLTQMLLFFFSNDSFRLYIIKNLDQNGEEKRYY